MGLFELLFCLLSGKIPLFDYAYGVNHILIRQLANFLEIYLICDRAYGTLYKSTIIISSH